MSVILKQKEVQSNIYKTIKITLEYREYSKEDAELLGHKGMYLIFATNSGAAWYVWSITYCKGFLSEKAAIKRFNLMDDDFMYYDYYKKDTKIIK